MKYIVPLFLLILFSSIVYGAVEVGFGDDSNPLVRISDELYGLLNGDNIWTGNNNFTGNATFNNFVIINYTNINASGEINATAFCLNGACVYLWSEINNSIWTRLGSDTFLTNTGDKVGIGTSDPTHELHVVGDANITGTAYVHALDGNSPILVKNDMILDAGYNVTANYYLGSGKYLTDINLSSVNGTATFYGDVNILGNLNLSGDLDMQNFSIVNVNQLYMGDYIEGGLIYLDSTHLYSIFWNETEQKLYLPGNTTIVPINNVSYNFTSSITLNGTTIYDWDDVGQHIYEEDVIISVSGGSGSGTTSICCTDAEILQVSVYPTTASNTYHSHSNETGTSISVDTDRIEHTGDWLVGHRGSVVFGNTITHYITDASIDESFTVRVRYLQ